MTISMGLATAKLGKLSYRPQMPLMSPLAFGLVEVSGLLS